MRTNAILPTVLTVFLLSVVIQPVAAQPRMGKPAVVGEEFVLAFARMSGTFPPKVAIQVSRSTDTLAWVDANFPDISSKFGFASISGVGVCGSTDRKTLMVVFGDRQSGSVYSVTGHLTAGSVSWDALAWHDQSSADGAPSCAFLQGDYVVIGMIHNKTAVAGIYNAAAGGVANASDLTLSFVNNSDSSGAVVTVIGKTVTMAWRVGQSRIEIAQGDAIESAAGPKLMFSSSKQRTLNLSTAGLGAQPLSDPALFSDGKRLYVATIQEWQPHSDPLHPWTGTIYRSASADVQSDWTLFRQGVSLKEVSNQAHIAAAAKEGGEIVLAHINQAGSAVGATILSDNSSAGTGSAPWVNDAAVYLPFGMTRLGSLRPERIVRVPGQRTPTGPQVR